MALGDGSSAMSPVEALPDEKGAVKGIRFERMVTKEGKLRGSGEFFELPARTVCVAAGTPGTWKTFGPISA